MFKQITYLLFLTTSLFSLEEKVAELFVIRVAPRGGSEHFQEVKELFGRYPTLGGVILKDANPTEITNTIDWLYTLSPHSKLIMTDAEWGLGMRLHDVMSFPKQCTLGAIQDESLIYEMGKEVARQALALGIDVNLAPVVDVNSNPKNPIINVRSFGSDPLSVARKAGLFAKGMRDEGLFSVIKHFPGHGDASVDSHHDLPIIHLTREEMEAHLYPFKTLIDQGIDGVMTAHLYVEALQERNHPATMDPQVVQHILRDEWHYDGLIITDALNMAALTKYYSFEQIAIESFLAGHDILLYGDHIAPKIREIITNQVPRAIQGLTTYIKENKLEEELDKRLSRIRRLKEKKVSARVPLDQLQSVLFSPEALALKEKLYQAALTIKGPPFHPEPGKNIRYLFLGDKNQELCLPYLTFGKPFTNEPCDTLLFICLGLFKCEEIAQIATFAKEIVWCHLASPYVPIPLEKINSLYLAYESEPEAIKSLFSQINHLRAF